MILLLTLCCSPLTSACFESALFSLFESRISRGWVPSYLQGFASSFGNGVATSGLHAIRGILRLMDFSLFLLVPSGVCRRDDILYARSDAESASLLCFRTSLVEIYNLNSESWLHNFLLMCRVMLWVRDGLITIRLLLSFALAP